MATDLQIGCVVLASENGQQSGSGKQKIRDGKGHLIQRVLKAVPTGLDTVVVSQSPNVFDLAAAFGFSAVYCGLPGGMADSGIRAGLSRLLDCRGVLVLTVDQICLKRDCVEALVALWAQNPERIACLSHVEDRKVPWIFPSRLFPLLMGLTGDADVDAVVRHLGEIPLALEADLCERTDTDIPDV